MTRLITEDISLQKVLQKFETFIKIVWQAYLQKCPKQLFYICPKISKFQSDSSMMSLPISWLLDWDLKKTYWRMTLTQTKIVWIGDLMKILLFVRCRKDFYVVLKSLFFFLGMYDV